MNSLKHSLNTLLTELLRDVSGNPEANANVITASKPEFGDYQANGVMAVAKSLKSNPRALAQSIVDKAQGKLPTLVARLEVAGPGFINIYLADSALLDRANTALTENAQLLPRCETAQTIVIDYSSPNLAKEMHVGHLRGTIIGDSLARLFEAVGHHVIRQNHVGDWGTQFGMLITYMQEFSTSADDNSSNLGDLEQFYRAAKARFDSDLDFADRARRNVVQLQKGDPQMLRVWQHFIDESLRHCETVYQKLNITLTRADLKPESFYNDELGNIVNTLRDRGLLSVSEGANCVFLPQFTGKDGDPLPVIIQKSDGGYLYATTDLAAVKYRAQVLQAQRSLYVVDARQSLHFQQVFAVAQAAGLAGSEISLEHIAYGTMMGNDGKPFKTRSGDTIKLAELLDEAVRRAYDLVTDKNPQLAQAERKNIAEVVGIAAVKYADLSKNRTSDYVFDWSTMLAFEGNTAPYLLYAYARIKSVLRKQSDSASSSQITSLEDPLERALLLKLLQFAEIVEAVVADCFPNQLCTYLYELSGSFMRFYEGCPILKAEVSLRDSRLALADLTARTLQKGLHLLGIDTLEQM
jgi:arginyl-tRNA synthetase